jgi:mannose-6-phosphate isomerase-like protein (cupin superfamily)
MDKNLLLTGDTTDHFNLTLLAKANTWFRNVVYTTQQTQLVTMSLAPGRSIPTETHLWTTQIINVVSGTADIAVDSTLHKLKAGDTIIVPAGSEHTVSATGKETLKLWTLYSPPEHEPNLQQL